VAAFVKAALDLHCDDSGRWFWLEGWPSFTPAMCPLVDLSSSADHHALKARLTERAVT